MQWDHPVFSELMDSMAHDLNNIKFAAYRMASKLRRVQTRLRLEMLDLEAACVCFELHGLSKARHSFPIHVPEMVVVLTSIFETLKTDTSSGRAGESEQELNVALQVSIPFSIQSISECSISLFSKIDNFELPNYHDNIKLTCHCCIRVTAIRLISF